jgi:pimeloyl-ACP methyl ester carboxylesterase
MRHPTPTPPELGTHDGLAYALFLPEREPDVGVVVIHGAGSAKESHFDFARGCRADGMAALAYDARGHGRSEGEFGPGAFDDALAMVELLRSHVPQVALRGSSMGGFQAIHAAAEAPGGAALCAVVAICPAPESGLVRFLRSGRRPEFRCDADASGPWLESLDSHVAAATLAPETALLLMHARGDEQVPYTVSESLFEAAGEPKRCCSCPAATTARSSTTRSFRPCRASSSATPLLAPSVHARGAVRTRVVADHHAVERGPRIARRRGVERHHPAAQEQHHEDRADQDRGGAESGQVGGGGLHQRGA